MTSLFDGFLESELTGHNSLLSIDALVSEARVDERLKQITVTYAQSRMRIGLAEYKQALKEEPITPNIPSEKEMLTRAEEVLCEQLDEPLASAGKYEAFEDQLLAFVSTLGVSLFVDAWYAVTSKQEVCPALARCARPSLYAEFSPKVATVLAEIIRSVCFGEEPIGFYEFCLSCGHIGAADWEEAFGLYEGDPALVLFDALEAQGLRGSLNAESFIWHKWDVTRGGNFEGFKECIERSLDWHQRLVNLGRLPMAKEFGDRCFSRYWSGQISDADVDAQELLHWVDQKRAVFDWQRLSHPAGRETIEDECTFLRTSFPVGQSFLHSECSLALAQEYIEATLRVFEWDADQERVVPDFSQLEVCQGCWPDAPLKLLPQLWYASPYREAWVFALNDHLQKVSSLEKIKILRYLLKYDVWRFGNPQLPEEDLRLVEVNQDDRARWFKKLYSIPEKMQSNKERLSATDLIGWLNEAVAHSNSFGMDNADLVPVADKIIAWSRPGLYGEGEDFSVEGLQQAVSIMMLYAPDKLLRNLLVSFRKSPVVASNEALGYGAGDALVSANVYKHPTPWWISIMINGCLRSEYAWQEGMTHNWRLRASLEDDPSAITLRLRLAFAEFCWKSLRLKKGERCDSDHYTNEQCTESEPYWRQTCAMALHEVGLNLGGKVHKTLNFVREKDPDEHVRKAAAEAYKSVRRQHHHNEDAPVNGLLIAFWWLRLAQRRALNEEVDPAAATRTRRNELRYATRVQDLMSLIA